MGMGAKAMFLIGGITLAFVSCTGALFNMATEEAEPGQGKDQQFFGEFAKRSVRNTYSAGKEGAEEIEKIGKEIYEDSGFSREEDCTKTNTCFEEPKL